MTTPTQPEEMRLGQKLRKVRKSKNLSLRQVEEATGISNPYLSQLETGKIKKPSPFFLHKLAKIYSIPYENLMEDAGYLHPEDTRPQSATEAKVEMLEELAAQNTNRCTYLLRKNTELEQHLTARDAELERVRAELSKWKQDYIQLESLHMNNIAEKFPELLENKNLQDKLSTAMGGAEYRQHLEAISAEAHKHVNENGFGPGREIIGMTDEALQAGGEKGGNKA
jgi:transcriptional regulator with XRE-family HTH domain